MKITTLRPYQDRAFVRVKELLGQRVRRILLVSPTGSGKGSLCAYMLHGAAQKGSRTLFIVRGRQLVQEFSQRLTLQYGVPHGVLMGGKKESREWPTQVASIDTLARRLDNLPPADLIIADEADQSISAKFTQVIERYPHAAIIGPTATPIRADGKGLGRVFNTIVEAATPRELMDAGYLADYDGVAFESEMTDDELAAAGKSDDGAQRVYSGLSESRREKRRGHIVEAWYQHLGEGSHQHDGEHRQRPAATVGFPITCDDSRDIVQRFNNERLHGAPVCVAVHVDGDTPLTERERIHEMLRAGEVHLVSSVGVLGRGVDWPVLEGCCLWRPTGSLAWHIQAIGRVLRPYAGKQRAMFLDHVGNFQKHGLPDDPREWSLDDGVCTSKGETLPSLTTCVKCKGIYRGDVCRRCGLVREVKEREILEKLDAIAVDIRTQERKTGASQDEEALRKHIRTLLWLARKQGRTDGWARGVFRKQHPAVEAAVLDRIAGEVMAGRGARV